jgi:hypothetical protein
VVTPSASPSLSFSLSVSPTCWLLSQFARGGWRPASSSSAARPAGVRVAVGTAGRARQDPFSDLQFLVCSPASWSIAVGVGRGGAAAEERTPAGRRGQLAGPNVP